MNEEPTPENQRQEREWVQLLREFLNHMRVVRQENQRREQALLRTPKKAIVEAISTFVMSILLIPAATLQLLEWISTKTVPWYEYAGLIAAIILGVGALVASGKNLLIFSIRRYKRKRMPVAPEEEPRRE
jgi:hypothetical protein